MRKLEQKPRPEQLAPQPAALLQPGANVTLRGGAGRIGRILSPSILAEYDWLVQWSNTNLCTHELERQLRFAQQLDHPITQRRGAGRSTSSVQLPATSSQISIVRSTPAKERDRRAS